MELTNHALLLITILVIIFLLVVLYFCFRTTPRLEKQKKEDTGEIKFKVETSKEECKIPDTPLLRCYDYFELPDAGGYTVKTCGLNKEKLFIQWFPVSGAEEYVVYANRGRQVSSDDYIKKWIVSNSNNYLETEELSGDCWSVLVVSVNHCGESKASKIFTTCN